MPDDSFHTIRLLLASKDPKEILKGLRLVAIEITKIGSSEAKPLFEMVSSLFYIDALERPELVPVIDEAVRLAATFGGWVNMHPPIIRGCAHLSSMRLEK
ncbi:MAG: hypothetical protein ABSC60_15275 [Acidobacteriota bacterium]